MLRLPPPRAASPLESTPIKTRRFAIRGFVVAPHSARAGVVSSRIDDHDSIELLAGDEVVEADVIGDAFFYQA